MKYISITIRLATLLIAGAFITANGYAQSFLTGQVAYYPFSGNANDASGNGFNGTVVNAMLGKDRFGNSNSCYEFDGSSAYIQLPLNTGNLNGSNQVTISAWINPQTTKVACIFSHWGTGYFPPPEPVGIMFDVWTTNRLMGSLASDSDSVYSIPTIPTNKWSHAVLVFDGTQLSTNRIEIYINGNLVGKSYQNPSDIPSQVASLADATLIGARTITPIEFFNGELDDVRIFNRALSSTEIQQLYSYEFGPKVGIVEAVKPSFSNLSVGTNYQLQVSTDLNNWTNQGASFNATSSSMIYTQYFDVLNWNKLFFRLQVAGSGN